MKLTAKENKLIAAIDALKLNKNEIKEVNRIELEKRIGSVPSAQRSVDIWLRSASASQIERRKAAVRLLGLSDKISFS